MKLLGLRRTVICPVRLMGDDGMTEVATVAPAIVEPKRPGKAALKEPEERAEVAVEVEFDMIGARSGGRRKRDRRRCRDESQRRR
jgi:hypothetical protein